MRKVFIFEDSTAVTSSFFTLGFQFPNVLDPLPGRHSPSPAFISGGSSTRQQKFEINPSLFFFCTVRISTSRAHLPYRRFLCSAKITFTTAYIIIILHFQFLSSVEAVGCSRPCISASVLDFGHLVLWYAFSFLTRTAPTK